jgi:hypothetical protein
MKDPENIDLIRQMKQVLQAYEEPYMEGAWEQFSAKPKKRLLPYWSWAAVAAVFIILGSVWIFSYKQTSGTVQLKVAEKKLNMSPPAKQSPDSRASITDQFSPGEKHAGHAKHLFSKRQSDIKPTNNLEGLLIAENNIEVASSLAPGLLRSAEVQYTERKPTLIATDKFMNFLVNQGKEADQEKIAKKAAKLEYASNWGFGVEVLPTVSEAALSVGAGLTTQYKISEHFSVGSGISYVQLQAGKSLTPGVSLLSSKQLQSVNANFQGIDIPLNLVYNINKSIYTAVGVSYFNVIKEDRKNTFISEREVTALSTNPVTGLAANTRSFVSETTQEPATESLLNGRSYLGFFNFSIGRKQELFKKRNIFIEPFIKVPIGKLSQQELKMMNGGMKFRLAF